MNSMGRAVERGREPRTAAGFPGLLQDVWGEEEALMVQERGYRKASFL